MGTERKSRWAGEIINPKRKVAKELTGRLLLVNQWT
jgi:hypothetical protein